MFTGSVGDKLLFQACSDILDEELRPIHYEELTKLAMYKIGVDQYNLAKKKEDVREKMLEKGRYGTMYNSLCQAVKTSWLRVEKISGQMLLLPRPFPVPVTRRVLQMADEEARCRQPYMINKFKKSKEDHFRCIVDGFIVEKAVCMYLQNRWPGAFLNADNHQKWSDPCDHDFKLIVRGKCHKFDVARRNRFDEAGCHKYKRPTDWHIVAYRECSQVWIEAFWEKDDFIGTAYLQHGRDVRQLFFSMNCDKYGIDLRSACEKRGGKATVQ